MPLPSLDTLRLLYFQFIYRGKGIEDLLEALADLFASAPEMRQRVRLTWPAAPPRKWPSAPAATTSTS